MAREMYAVYFGLVAVLSSFGPRFVGRYCSIIDKMPGACMNWHSETAFKINMLRNHVHRVFII